MSLLFRKGLDPIWLALVYLTSMPHSVFGLVIEFDPELPFAPGIVSVLSPPMLEIDHPVLVDNEPLELPKFPNTGSWRIQSGIASAQLSTEFDSTSSSATLTSTMRIRAEDDADIEFGVATWVVLSQSIFAVDEPVNITLDSSFVLNGGSFSGVTRWWTTLYEFGIEGPEPFYEHRNPVLDESFSAVLLPGRVYGLGTSIYASSSFLRDTFDEWNFIEIVGRSTLELRSVSLPSTLWLHLVSIFLVAAMRRLAC